MDLPVLVAICVQPLPDAICIKLAKSGLTNFETAKGKELSLGSCTASAAARPHNLGNKMRARDRKSLFLSRVALRPRNQCKYIGIPQLFIYSGQLP
jgi:hypothetical protein